MSRKRKAILLMLPVLVLILALLISSVGVAAPGKGFNNGKGVIHELYYAPDGTVYNAIYHANTGELTVTGAIYPQSGPLK